MYPLEQALKAQQALRAASGQGPELFPLQAFVGMISDEIEQLRALGKSDQEIVDLVKASSGIDITPQQIAENYATPEERRRPDHQAVSTSH